jgi:hypothetical protein
MQFKTLTLAFLLLTCAQGAAISSPVNSASAEKKPCGCPTKCPKEPKVKCGTGEKKCKFAGFCSFIVICDDIIIPCGADAKVEGCVPRDFDCGSL